ncbi:unnamed protein product [Toxocara canis]|uniref:Protein kinase domain-containing protein n=1 Tax=Toxocara canis TaxID=6265 RepID=A0A183UMQ2_TOXCA|nr:unnamed protein product [Toxocara canis]
MESVYEHAALELPAMTAVTRGTLQLRMKNLRLHSCGVFGNVYRGTLLCPAPQREIALKKTWQDAERKQRGIHLELNILLGLSREKHKNIIQLLYTFRSITPDKRICESMVFDYMPVTLSTIVKQIGGAHPDYLDIKLYTWQLFNGLMFLFHSHICHRDIKPQNLLVDPAIGNLKIADFGSAKIIKHNVQSTSYQITRFYRPPELLLGATFYSSYVDVWSGGCVYGELLRGGVLFPGNDTNHQLKLIMDALGTPDEDELNDMAANTRIEGTRSAPRGFKTILQHASAESIALIARILVYRPKSRLCNTVLLMDPFFDDLFEPGKQRRNGSYISNAITIGDLNIIRRQSKKMSDGGTEGPDRPKHSTVSNLENGF